MDLERLALAVLVLFSRKVGSEDQSEVDRRCENIARLILNTPVFTSLIHLLRIHDSCRPSLR